jgi:hypothetical protein
MRMFQRPPRRAKCKNLNRNHLNRNRVNWKRLNRDRKSGRGGKSRRPLNRNLLQGMRTAVEDAGEAEVVAAEAVVARRQVFLPDKLKQPLL